jgi:hypothetical protein
LGARSVLGNLQSSAITTLVHTNPIVVNNIRGSIQLLNVLENIQSTAAGTHAIIFSIFLLRNLYKNITDIDSKIYIGDISADIAVLNDISYVEILNK